MSISPSEIADTAHGPRGHPAHLSGLMSQGPGPPRNRETAAESSLIVFEHFPLSFVCSGALDDAFRLLDHEPRWLKQVLTGPRDRVTSVTDAAPVTSVNRPQ